mmetsp:Transcript_33264/g.69675  ORF Transcript_33264/g.69675 Transcript_33264/m.69675 type:complete len:505 (-) Transcript_33264:236-1750(-)
MKALKEAILLNDVLTIKCRPDICNLVGFPYRPSSSTKFLIRKDYERLWTEIMQGYNAGNRKSIVVGTAGIGKSLFRFYLARKWLLGDPDILGIFKDVRFNIGNSFFLVRKDGAVLKISDERCLLESDESLVLLDPCIALSGIKDVLCKLLIITSSPSALVGHSSTCSLSQFRKLAIIFVMRMWTKEEWFRFSPGTDRVHFAKFSSREGFTTFCVPRWLSYTPMEIEGQLLASLNEQHSKGLCRFILSTGNRRLMGAYLPYRLCKVYQPGYNQWEVYGFISDYVSNYILVSAGISDQVNKANFLTLLHSPWSGGLLGHCFENWAFELLEARNELIVFNGVHSTFRFDSMNYFNFVPRKPIPCVLVGGVLQRPDQASMPSIDAYGIVEKTLLLLHFTVGLTHSDALWKHVRHIVKAARKKNPEVQVLMVYVVPEPTKFSIPKCESLKKNQVVVVAGQLNADFFPKALSTLSRQQNLEERSCEEEHSDLDLGEERSDLDSAEERSDF